MTELKNILIKYVPEISLGAQRDALRELFLFEDDLNRHSLIENHILVPIVTELEKVREMRKVYKIVLIEPSPILAGGVKYILADNAEFDVICTFENPQNWWDGLRHCHQILLWSILLF